MNKKKLMELISNAIDQGAYLSIHMGQYDQSTGGYEPRNQNIANYYINEFKKAIGTDNEIEHEINDAANNYSVNDKDIYVSCSYIPTEEKEVTV